MHHPNRHAHYALESLESRRLLSTTFLYESIPDAFGVPAVLHDLSVNPDAAALGISVTGVGDIDGDGLGDFLVGLAGRRGTDDVAAIAGAARLHSGATGAVLFDLSDGNAGFGASIAGVGDIDNDGVPDFLVGSPLATNPDFAVNPGEHGFAYLYSGADGALLRTFEGVEPGFVETGIPDHFGHAVARIGDIDGDAVPDLLIGAPGGGDVDQGEVYLFSGATGALLRTFSGEAPGDRFGFAIADAGDIPAALDEPGDGLPDVLVGAPGADIGGLHTETGKAYVFDSVTGDLILLLTPDLDGVNFGHAVAGVDDAPGEVRLAVGAPSYEDGRGILFLFTPHDPDIHATHYGEAGSRFGSTLANVGDLRGFGTDVLAVGALLSAEFPGGSVTFYQTAVDHTLQRIGSAAGSVVAGVGDLDEDGLADVVSAFAGDSEGPGDVRVLSGAGIDPLTLIDGASDNLAYAWANGRRRLVINGRPIAYNAVPGLGNARIIAISDSGQILADDGGFGIRPPFLIVNGERVNIPDDVTEVVGRELPAGGLYGRDVGEQGQVLLEQSITEDGGVRTLSWLFQDGVLTFLWDGDVREINASGFILGSRDNAGTPVFTTVLRAPDGAITELPGFDGRHLADDGVIGGNDSQVGPALWHAGVVTELLPADSQGHVVGLTTGGRVLVNFSGVAGRIGFSGIFYREPGKELTFINGLVVNAALPLNFGQGSTFAMSPDGRILSRFGLLTPVESGERFTPADGAPVATATQGEVVTTFTVGMFGDLIIFRSDGSEWISAELPTANHLLISPDERFTAFTDPGDGQVYVVVTGEARGTRLYRTASGSGILTLVATLDADAPAANRLVENLTTFTSTDGRAHIAGTNANDEWIVHFQTGERDPVTQAAAWASSNLSTDHLAPQGFTVPALTGVTSYVTPWNALNIVGIDASGDIHAIWWAGELELWRVHNLSEVARAHAARHALPLTIPAFTGNVTAFVTSWNAIHIAATTGDRDATPLPRRADEIGVLWWAPSLGEAWASSVLGPPAGSASPTFAPGTLTSFATPWGGLTIAGIASETTGTIAAGEIAVYWWTPATITADNPSGWNLSSLHDSVVGATPPPVAGPLTSIVTPAGVQHLFADQSETSDLLGFRWTPESGSAWALSYLSPLGA